MTDPLRILILEDNPADAELVQFELEEAGFTFTPKVVVTEKDFVQAIQDFSPDLILSDYDLPKYNGALALAEARRRCPDTPFILVTGAVTEDRAIDILTQGAKDYVLKNRLQQRLIPAVKRALAEAEEHRARKQAEAELRDAHRNLEERVKIRTAELEAAMTAQKKMEEAAAAAHRQIQSIIDNTTAIIYAFDPEGRFVMANTAVAELLNSTPEKMIGKRRHEFMPKDDADWHEANDRQVIESGRALEFEEYSQLKGRSITWLTTKFPLRDGQGRIYAAGGISTDVSERKQAEAVVRESEREKSLILENANEIIAYHDAEQNLVWANRAYLVATGLPLSDLRSKKCYICWGLGQVCVNCPVSDTIRTGEPQSAELTQKRYLRKDGEAIWIALSGSLLRDSDGKPAFGLAMVQDITDRKRAEATLRESEERIQQALCVSHSFTFEWELATDRVRRSESCATMLGLTGDEAVNDTGQNYFQRVHPDDRARFVAMLDRLTPANASYTAEYRVVRGDGHVVVFEETGAATFDAAGKLARLAGVTTDITVRKQAEAELARTKTLLETLLTQAPVGFAYFDRELRYVLINDQLASVNGLPVAAHIGKTVGEILPTLLPAVQQVISQILATGQPVRDHEFSGQTASQPGVTRYWNESWYPVCDAAGEIVGFGAVVEETTARKRAEEALRESENRLWHIAQAGRIGIFEWNATTDAAYWSREHYELFGMAPGTPISWERWRQGVHPDDRERVEQNAARMLEQGRAQGQVRNHTDEYRYRRPDGTEVWLESNVSLDMVGNEAIIRGSVRDVTDRKQAEDALRASEARFRLTLKNSPVLVTLQDTNLVYQWVFNTRTRRPEEVVGKTDADLFAPDEAAALSAAKSQVLETGTEVRETFWLTSNGQRVFLDCYYEPVRDAAGKIIGVGGASVDLTEQKQAEEALTERTRQLDDANEELDSFAYSVSHDLRAPLRAIDGFARMILKQQGDKFDEKTRNQFDVIIKNTKMMGQLIEDLLALSRLGREAISMSKLNIEDLARDVWEELNAINPDRPVDLKIDHAPPATGDRSFIKQVLVNLLSNAIKFTRIREVPLIEVGGYDGKAENVYYVRDNGVGFDMQYLDKLFGVFQRLHSTNEYEGTGIGLALVKRIIHRHGGRVWAEAEVGKGATFYFTLPTR